MKKLWLLLLCFTFLPASKVVAQNEDTERVYTHVLSIHPFSFTVGGFEMGYEFATRFPNSLRVQAGYFLSGNAPGLDGKNLEGLKLETQYRFYLQEKKLPLRGGYVAPYALYKQMQFESYEYNNFNNQYVEKQGSAWGAGVLLGTQGNIGKRTTIDLYVGGGVVAPIDDKDVEQIDIPIVNPYKKAIVGRVSLTIGVAL
ncbi:MAG: DUF3575 domain-containing protein [Chitinophagales bacterium]|nr:DUF3575 domain-containing protein [Bacteroidota bacterium]MCB9042788.1 DUF3575 domain-containing protein [Chitinophagales bacterium]